MTLVTCPRCSVQFQGVGRLARHLESRRRRLRCGMYKGEVVFICDCGRRFTRIRMIKKHLRQHHSNPVRLEETVGSPSRPRATMRPVGYYNEEDDDEVETSRDVAGGTEGPVIYRPAMSEPLINGNPQAENALVENAVSLIGSTSENISYKLFKDALDSNERLKSLTQLYRHCLSSHCTTRAYRELVGLDVIDTSYDIPKHRENLRKIIMEAIASTSRWVSMQTFSLPIYKQLHISPTPCITVRDALNIWLALPIILSAVRKSMVNHLPANLLDMDAYDKLIEQRSQKVKDGRHIYSSVADGSEYLPSVRACVPKFASAYVEAAEDDVEVIVCTVGFYEDGYSKQKDSLVSQLMFCLILLEAAAGEASLTGLSSLVVMLADTVGTKTLGTEIYWKRFVDEFHKFESGVRMKIAGEECLVICLPMFLLADTLALKSMVGLSTSISSTCYVRMPCRSCEVLMEDLPSSLHPAVESNYRRIETYSRFYRYNNFCTGSPVSVAVEQMMKEYGIVRVSEFVRIAGLMSPHKLGTDSMHAVYLGALKNHFIHSVVLLTSIHSGCSKTFSNVWESISRVFRCYCNSNGISSCWKFSSMKEFKCRVKAGSMRELARAAPYIFYAIGLIELNNRHLTAKRLKKHMRVFNFLLLHIKIAETFEQRSISSCELKCLSKAIEKLLEYFYTDFPPEFATINVHYYKHITDQVDSMGPLRIAANDGRERLVRWLKFRYKNTSTFGREVSVYIMYLDNLFFHMQEADEDIYKSEIIPNCLVEFNCSPYSMLCIDSGDSLQHLHVNSLQTECRLMYDNNRKLKMKLQCCDIKKGNYVLLSAGCGMAQCYVASVISIVEWRGEHYIAHCLPKSTSKLHIEGTIFDVTTVGDDLEDVLYLCPVDRFMKPIPTLKLTIHDETILIL